MTLADILTNDNLRLQEFPVAGRQIFLAHAGVSPLPRRVVQPMQDYLAACLQQEQEGFVLESLLRDTKAGVARLLGAQPDEIAFVGPTSIGLSYVAAGLRFQPGENIVGYFDDYPSNVYPWLALKDKGVELRSVKPAKLGVITQAEVAGLIDTKTRLVALASSHFISGARIDLEAMGRFLREREVLFCVDAIQTLGAFPLNVEQIDFLAADSHKWLLGPCGTGIFYVRKSRQEALHPSVYGWNNVRCPNYVAQDTIRYRPGAQRYEAGTHNLAGLVGLKAAVELLLDVGVANIAAELRRKRDWFVPALAKRGYDVADSGEAHQASGIISLYKAGADLRGLHQKLFEHRVIASLRFDRQGQNYLRLSPHFYNTDAELEKVLELLG